MMPHTTLFPNQAVRTLLKTLMDMVTNAPTVAKASEQDDSQSESTAKVGTAESPERSTSKCKLAALKAARASSSSSPATSSSGPPVSSELPAEIPGRSHLRASPENTDWQSAMIASSASRSSGDFGRVEDQLRASLHRRPHTSNNPPNHAISPDVDCSIGGRMELQRPASQPLVPSMTLPPLRTRQSLPAASEPRAPTGPSPSANGIQFVRVPEFQQIPRKSSGSWRPAQNPPPFPPPAGPPPEAIPGCVAAMSQTMPTNMDVQHSGRGSDWAASGPRLES